MQLHIHCCAILISYFRTMWWMIMMYTRAYVSNTYSFHMDPLTWVILVGPSEGILVTMVVHMLL